ncbi:MAG TPA: hypothetical protein PLL93_14020, partial [bacterium]|nr:hypothetical protein [bacterium]
MNKMLVKNLFFLALFVTVAVVNSQETGVITGVVIPAAGLGTRMRSDVVKVLQSRSHPAPVVDR